MNNFSHIKWHNPKNKIWGFHIHQELPIEDFSKALVIQKNCAEFLNSHHIKIDADDAIKPGYGPHLNYLWELRIEKFSENMLENMGLAISYMSVNRMGLTSYIHPLMHDSSLPQKSALAEEGKYNQDNAIWFGQKIFQNQNFFFEPPINNKGEILDTRTSRIMSPDEKLKFLNLGYTQLNNNQFIEPDKKILKGFHIHMDFSESDKDLALTIFNKFCIYLLNENLIFTSTRLYEPRENGPHILGGWEVKFETHDSAIFRKIGIAIGWLMCNKQGLSVFMHPVTWVAGDNKEEVIAHKEYSFFLGNEVPLDLAFFD